MHPGWKVFMQGALCGMFIVGVMGWIVREDWLGASVCGAIFIISYACGARNAEGLIDRRSVSLSQAQRDDAI